MTTTTITTSINHSEDEWTTLGIIHHYISTFLETDLISEGRSCQQLAWRTL
jgi:hypothetical protein